MSFDLFRRNSGGEMEPIRMFTRRSSCEDNNKTPGFIYTIENWKRSDSKT
jgi:hypothetical protein